VESINRQMKWWKEHHAMEWLSGGEEMRKYFTRGDHHEDYADGNRRSHPHRYAARIRRGEALVNIEGYPWQEGKIMEIHTT
jgi:hypothetical protein